MSGENEKIDLFEELSDEAIDKLAEKLYQRLLKYFEETDESEEDEDCDCKKEIKGDDIKGTAITLPIIGAFDSERTENSDEEIDDEPENPIDPALAAPVIELPTIGGGDTFEEVSQNIKISKMLSEVFTSDKFVRTNKESTLYVEDVIFKEGYAAVEVGKRVIVIDTENSKVKLDVELDGKIFTDVEFVIEKRESNIGVMLNSELIK